MIEVEIKQKIPINNYLDTSLNYRSIRSCVISQPKIKLFSNSEQLFNAMDPSPITLGFTYNF